MEPTPVIAVFDVGKTNKKLLLFDEQYLVAYEHSEQLVESVDDDGDPCEDVAALTNWMKDNFAKVHSDPGFQIKAINFSGYGASFVYIDDNGKVTAPLYNYLKACPLEFQKKFYRDNGQMDELCVETASPALGSLNSGLQLYRIKLEKPSLYKRIRYALHLPQYLSYVFSGVPLTGITSIGCHTHLWDFSRNAYSAWVQRSGLIEKFPPLTKQTVAGMYQGIPVGPGYHDSSAALVPYRMQFNDPFVLVSTGTWCISMNPFNQTPLTIEDFGEDCLCYLAPDGSKVKSSRYFSGRDYGQIVNGLIKQYGVSEEKINAIEYDPSLIPGPTITDIKRQGNHTVVFDEYHDLDFAESYHLSISHLVSHLREKIDLVMTDDTRNIFVDGGFSRNKLFMQILAAAYPSLTVAAAKVPQASAIGAALLMHDQWNSTPIPGDVVETIAVERR